jgi:carbamate kinase
VRVVVALGGNALLERGERPDAALQERRVADAAAALAPLAERHELIVTHGNGPQVGMLALESAGDPALTRPYPFDVLGAQSQAMVGYWLVQGLQNLLGERSVACVLTRTLVDTSDPAFSSPSKFIGPVYDEAEAKRLAAAHGWVVRPDGPSWRRVVASPRPRRVIEAPIVAHLASQGVTVVCAGGGGVPVAADQAGWLHGVEAVVDKDRVAALLAERVDADALVLLTDVEGVFRCFGGPDASLLRAADVDELRLLALPEGSMGPKVEAACRFVERTGRQAAIGSLCRAEAVLWGRSGTRVLPAGQRDGWDER